MDLIHKTIGTLLFENASKYENNGAVVYHDQKLRYTWGELNTLVKQTAKAFISLGIKKGDHIAIWGTNIPEWLLTQLATAKIGAVLVTINPEWKQEEIKYALAQSDTNYLVMIPGFEKKSKSKTHYYDYLSIIKNLCPEFSKNTPNPTCNAFPKLKQVILVSDKEEPDMLLWSNFIARAKSISDNDLKNTADKVHANDTAMIQYTSGTTGFPKGAMLSHFNIVNNALAAIEHMQVNEQDKICGPVPYYHCFGSILVNLCSVLSGACMVIPSETFSAHKTLEAVASEKCTVLYGVPTMFIAELDDLDIESFQINTLRTGIMAGAPVERELIEAVSEKMGAKEMTIAYGLTETSPVTHQTERNDSIDKRINSIGKPIQHTESKIVDPKTLEDLGVNEVGEIWVKGFHVMQGYYNKPEETQDAIVNGWLRTGDLGTVDGDNYYKVVGRLKELILVGGHNVYPAEVEQTLHSLLSDKVEQLQVVGVPHPKLQEVVALVVQCLPGKSITLEEVKQRCEATMEWPKIPKYVMAVKDFSMAMTVTGKIQKFKLRDMIMEKFQQTVQ
ncbi:MAG: AMP-binding protein [Bacteroidia bacterium]|nr:AMP-binding protein [Bacteroidia bacterium]